MNWALRNFKNTFFPQTKRLCNIKCSVFLCFAKVCEMGGYQVKAYQEVNSSNVFQNLMNLRFLHVFVWSRIWCWTPTLSMCSFSIHWGQEMCLTALNFYIYKISQFCRFLDVLRKSVHAKQIFLEHPQK